MSRSITQTSSSGSAVAAGSSVVAPVFTTTGFNAGDYVYTTPTGIGTRTTGNVSLGTDTPYVATTFLNTALSTASFRSASYGPLIDQGTFTGTTRAIGGVLIPDTTLKSAGATTGCRSCTLLNGNVFLVYSFSTDLYFQILDSTGAVVVAETTIVSGGYRTNTVSGNFACCTLTNGNVQVVYNNNTDTAYYSRIVIYSQNGAVVSPDTQFYTNVGSGLGNLSMASLSGGGSVVCGSSGFTSGIIAPYYVVLNSSGGATAYGQGSYSVSAGTNYYTACVGLPASQGTNIWAYFSQDTTGASGQPVLGIYTNGNAITSAGVSGAYTGAGSGDTFGITILTDGTIAAAGYNGSVYISKFTYTKSSNTSGSLTYLSSTFIASGQTGMLASTSNNGLICVSTNSFNMYINTLSSTNVATSQVLFGNGTYVGLGGDGQLAMTSLGSGIVSVMYRAYSSDYPKHIGIASISATNGVTQLTGNSYLPSGGYYLMGVAATNASANSTGQVVMNGTAQLGSSYPTVTTPIYYSYQTTASQPIFGQRGSVSATTVTLKGLE